MSEAGLNIIRRQLKDGAMAGNITLFLFLLLAFLGLVIS